MNETTIERDSRAPDGSVVAWTVTMPIGRSRGSVLMIPGLTGPRHPRYATVYGDLTQWLATLGFSAAIVTPRGQIGSGGYYSPGNVCDDVRAVLADWGDAEQPLGVFARSTGAGCALRVARDSRVQIHHILTWGACFRDVYVKLFGPSSDGSYMRACEDYGMRPTPRFYDELVFPEDEIDSVEVPAWFAVGTRDEYTDVHAQIELADRSRHPSSMSIALPPLVHRFDASYAHWPRFQALVLTWLRNLSRLP